MAARPCHVRAAAAAAPGCCEQELPFGTAQAASILICICPRTRSKRLTGRHGAGHGGCHRGQGPEGGRAAAIDLGGGLGCAAEARRCRLSPRACTRGERGEAGDDPRGPADACAAFPMVARICRHPGLARARPGRGADAELAPQPGIGVGIRKGQQCGGRKADSKPASGAWHCELDANDGIG